MAIEEVTIEQACPCQRAAPCQAFDGAGNLVNYSSGQYAVAFDEEGDWDGIYVHEPLTHVIFPSDGTVTDYATRGGSVTTAAGICGFINCIEVDSSEGTSYAYRNFPLMVGEISHLHLVIELDHDDPLLIRGVSGLNATVTDCNLGRGNGVTAAAVYVRVIKPRTWYVIIRLEATTNNGSYAGLAFYNPVDIPNYRTSHAKYQIFAVTQGPSWIPCWAETTTQSVILPSSYGYRELGNAQANALPMSLHADFTLLSEVASSPDGLAGVVHCGRISGGYTFDRFTISKRLFSPGEWRLISQIRRSSHDGVVDHQQISITDTPVAGLGARHTVSVWADKQGMASYNDDGRYEFYVTGDFVTETLRDMVYLGRAFSNTRNMNGIIHSFDLGINNPVPSRFTEEST